jgi:hypothetical protein
MNFHQILIGPSLRDSVVADLLIVDGLEPVVLNDLHQFFLEIDDFADHLAVEFKNLGLRRNVSFRSVCHSIGDVNVNLVLNLELQLGELPLQHSHALLVHQRVAKLHVLGSQAFARTDYLQKLADLVDLQLVNQLLLCLVFETGQAKLRVYLAGCSSIEETGNHGDLVILYLLDQVPDAAPPVSSLQDI